MHGDSDSLAHSNSDHQLVTREDNSSMVMGIVYRMGRLNNRALALPADGYVKTLTRVARRVPRTISICSFHEGIATSNSL